MQQVIKKYIMFKYFPHTEKDILEMIEKIGVSKIEDLFNEIPEEFLYKHSFDIPSSLSETELRDHIEVLASKNKKLISFLGAGSYDVYTPSVINAITSRQEFLTSYTPYQPEISQGTLQYIFEFQSMIAELTGMDVCNASVYDGATATAEAMFMAVGITKRNKVLISKTVNPRVLEVVKTYGYFKNIEVEYIEEVGFITSAEDLNNKLNNEVATVIVQNPNYFGVIENYDDLSDKVKNNKSLLIINVDPSTLSVLKTPKEIGADIVVGDGQTLGIPKSFGGPYLGFMATTNKYIRKLPGRICGMTNDIDGKRGYVLTLQAREQHIRRDKANSNICSNQSLMALHTVIYMSIMGKKGLIDVAKRAYNNAHYLFDQLLKTNLFEEVSPNSFFKEFVLKSKVNIKDLNNYLLDQGVLSGLDLIEIDRKYSDLIMFCATEVRTKEEIDHLVNLVEGFNHV